jgi:hypothetical protein
MATNREMMDAARKFGVDVIDDPFIDGHEFHRNEQYRAIWEAIRLLAHLPTGRAVSLPRDEKYAKVVAKKSHVYAKRWGLNIVTRNAGQVIVIARKVPKSNQPKGELNHQSGEVSVNNNQQGAALQPSVVPYMSGGTRA